MDLHTDFIETPLTLSPDEEGENIAMLVSSRHNRGNRDSVLYLHGLIDYFFHPHVAAAFHAKDMDFYALDLRKYGRALLPHQTPNYCEDLHEYFEEITIAITTMQAKTDKKLFILSHSTGCTIASLYMNQGSQKAAISGLILNSPFLEIPQNRLLTALIYHTAKLLVKIKPKVKLAKNSNHVYPKSIHKDFLGEWDYDLTLKPIDGFPLYYQWAIAIVNAQRYLQTQSNITVPILSMFSTASSKPKQHGIEAETTDIVLDVKHIEALSPKLGQQVTLVKINGAKHDIFLSDKTVRSTAFNKMFAWLASIR